MMQVDETFSEIQLKRTLKGVCLIVIILQLGLLFKYRRNLFIDEIWPILATASIVILLGLAGLYFYAYKFYRDTFYSFLSIGWLANAIYIFFDFFFINLEKDLTYGLEIYSLGIIVIVPFYLASFISVSGLPTKREVFISLLKWIVWLVGTFLFCYWITQVKYSSLDDETKFGILTVGGIPFTVWTLIRVGKCLGTRLEPVTYGRWSRLLPLTFYLYASAQPLYLMTLAPSLKVFTIVAFLYAYAIKITNTIGVLSILRLSLLELRLSLLKLQEQSEHRSELEDLGALAASIGHDIGTPLGIINLEINTMRRKFQSNSEILSNLDRLEEQSTRIYAVTKIITVLRGSKDYFESFMEKTNVRDLINHVIKDVKREMNIQNIAFKTDSKTLYIKSNRPMLAQVLVNILKNSIEAIREAERERGLINITLSSEKLSDKTVRVDITDNGCGIPEDNIPRLTSLFTTKGERKPNSGIGLFIANRIIKIHNGDLKIASIVGEGTTVSLLLPQWDSQANPDTS